MKKKQEVKETKMKGAEEHSCACGSGMQKENCCGGGGMCCGGH